MKKNPCEVCGACCAFFRVLFPSAEVNRVEPPVVPLAMIQPFDKTQSIMKGTELKNPRCAALEGRIGIHVKCRIYENRPSICRQFERSWEHNLGNSLCDRARSVYGLQPFSQY